MFLIEYTSPSYFFEFPSIIELNECGFELYEICGCDEFSEVQLRNNEKKTLNSFNRDKNRVTVR